MWKIILGVVAVIIVLGGGYYFLRGSTSEPTQQPSVSADASGLGSATASSTSMTASTTVTTTTTNTKNMKATLHTNKGDITVEFYPDQAPKTVANFLKLAESGYYNATKFHRVIKGFMDQGGDPLTKDDTQKSAWGTGGPGYTIPDEFGTTYTNTAGTLAMANTGQPNSGGSQFFINAVDNHFLDAKYTVFGKVVSGMDVVTAINNTPVDASDKPLTPVVLTSVTVTQ